MSRVLAAAALALSVTTASAVRAQPTDDNEESDSVELDEPVEESRGEPVDELALRTTVAAGVVADSAGPSASDTAAAAEESPSGVTEPPAEPERVPRPPATDDVRTSLQQNLAVSGGVTDGDIPSSLVTLALSESGTRLTGQATVSFSDTRLTFGLSALDDDRNGVADLVDLEDGLTGGAQLSAGFTTVVGLEARENLPALIRAACAAAGVAEADCPRTTGILERDHPLAYRLYRASALPIHTPLFVYARGGLSYHAISFRSVEAPATPASQDRIGGFAVAGLGYYALPRLMLGASVEYRHTVETPTQVALCTSAPVDGTAFTCRQDTYTRGFVEGNRLDATVDLRWFPAAWLGINPLVRLRTSESDEDAPETAQDERQFRPRSLDFRLGFYFRGDPTLRIGIVPGVRFHFFDRPNEDSRAELLGTIFIGGKLPAIPG